MMRHGLPTGTVTFLFTDIEGSTRLLHELGDAYPGVVTAHRRIVRDVVARHAGVEVDTQGDSFFIAFAEPTAAVEAATEIQTALGSHRWPGDAAVRVRMGLHTGEPFISDAHYFGVDVHRAARIAAAAHGGQVLVSEHAKELLTSDGNGHFRDMGVHQLKDLPEPERLFQLLVDGLPSTFPPPRAHEDAMASAGLPDYSLVPADVPCPYKGLVPFEPEDTELFFGREELVEQIVDRLSRAPFLAVLGPSGSGKSSVVRAGVVPDLERDSGATASIITPGEHPLGELAETSGAPVLVVDQFEEVFTLCADEEERRAFIDGILERADDGTTVIIALRADFYGHCAAYPRLAATLGDQQVLVGPMSEEELRRAVERPAEQAGLLLEPGVVEGIVRDVIGEPGALPLLSHALLETWKRRSGRMLTLLGYLQSGGVEGAIAKTAETVYRDALSFEQQALARSIFLRLTEVGEGTEETRRRVSVHELTPRTEQADDVAEVLQRLTDARLVIVDDGTVEVAHEALIRHWPTLRLWLDEDREGRLVHRRLTEAAREWDALGGENALLYRGMRLSGASEWAAAHDAELNELERAFLAASRAAELGEIEATRRRNRRLRILVAALALLLSAALVAGVFALLQRQQARSAETTAIAQRVGAQALVQKDLDKSLLLAREGVELDDSLATRGNLLAALVRSPAAIGVMRPLPGRLLGSAISPDGRLLAVSNNDRDAALIDTRTRRVVRTLKSDGVVFLQDGKRYVDFQLAQEHKRLVVRDVESGKALRVIQMHPGSSFWFSNDLSRIVVTEDGGRAVVRATSDDHVIERVPPSPGRSIWDVSMRDRNHLLTIEAPKPNPDCFAAGCVLVWHDLRTGRTVSSFTVKGFYGYGPSNDGTQLAVSRTDGSVSIYDLHTGARRDMQGRHNAEGANPWFSPDGKLLASGGDDRQVLVWDVASGNLIQTLTGHNGRVFSPSFSPDDRTLYTTSLDGSLIIWDLAGDRRLGRPFHAGTGNSLPADPSPDGLLAVSPSGPSFAVTQDDGKAVVYDSTTFAKKRAIDTAAGRLFDAAFSPDGRLLATAGADGSVGLWDVGSGKPLHERLPGPPRMLEQGRSNIALSVAFSPDERTIAAGDTSGAIYVWDAKSGKLMRAPVKTPIDPALPPPPPGSSLPGRLGIMGLAFSPDGQKLAAGHDTNATVYSLPSGRPLYTVDVDGNYGHASAVAFSPDGSVLATGGGTGEVRFWDAESGARTGRSLIANAGWVESVAFDPSGRLLVTSGSDGTTRLIDVAGRVILGTPLPGLDNIHEDAAFTPDGKRVLVMSDRGDGFAWDVTLAGWEKQACAVAGHDLTRDEWDEFLPERPFTRVCSQP